MGSMAYTANKALIAADLDSSGTRPNTPEPIGDRRDKNGFDPEVETKDSLKQLRVNPAKAS